MIISGTLTDVSQKLTFVNENKRIPKYSMRKKLSIAVFRRFLPHSAVFCRVRPVSLCYSACQTHRKAGTMSKTTQNQRYYDRRRHGLGTTGNDLLECVGNSTHKTDRAGGGDRRIGSLPTLLSARNAPAQNRTRTGISSTRPGDHTTAKGDHAPHAYSPNPATLTQNPSERHKIEQKAHPSHLFPRCFLHRSHILMLQCLLEAQAKNSNIETASEGTRRPMFKVHLRSVSGLKSTQNATVASSRGGPSVDDPSMNQIWTMHDQSTHATSKRKEA